ncbi:hypothetical protein SAMN04488058_101195 [Deinococcus reticulitermitis]|uniref:Uncharacterized protein n=1 Tax=Deinococcus reticulitermitis TaxID=856736 RepID=A0A1H6S5Y4_9DEIO|nr:hypothetical protein [Deinococcus reticulitermitis]SEI63473.1 hypothetical protein SAMN04488058_101195 [Deinococcus reticulitermitis]
MDLNSWTPNDKARRLAVLLAVYLSLSAALALGLGLGWTWYLAVLAGVLLYGVIYALSFSVLRRMFGG